MKICPGVITLKISWAKQTSDLDLSEESSTFYHYTLDWHFIILQCFLFFTTVTLFGGTKTMNNLQIQQNKAAKIILDKAKYSSATNALEILKWKLLDERRHMHRCICIFRCLNDIIDFDFNLKHNTAFYNYNASATNCIFQPPKQTSKNWHTRQQKTLTILIQRFRELNRFYSLKRKCSFYHSFLLYF